MRYVSSVIKMYDNDDDDDDDDDEDGDDGGGGGGGGGERSLSKWVGIVNHSRSPWNVHIIGLAV